MKISIQKYGGTSLKTIKHIQKIAKKLQKEQKKGANLVVILSAMGSSTDDLITLACEVHPKATGPAMDLLLSTGEQVSISLMSLALDQLNVPNKALNVIKSGVNISGKHTEAFITSIDTRNIMQNLEQNRICLVAGFQGKDENNEIYTLGRGGSDTTAIAIAVALKAKDCEIFTDVSGIYTADPNKVSRARKIKKIYYEEMLELARLGAGVLHSRAVELASKNKLVVHVRSSFNNLQGSFVVGEDSMLEQALVRGVSLKCDESRISLLDIEDRPGLAAKFFRNLAMNEIDVNMIVQSSGQYNKNSLSFTVIQEKLALAKQVSDDFIEKEGNARLEVDAEIAVLSIVGIGMCKHVGVAATIFKALAELNINIQMISTSEIKISLVIPVAQGQKALQSVHSALGLDSLDTIDSIETMDAKA